MFSCRTVQRKRKWLGVLIKKAQLKRTGSTISGSDAISLRMMKKVGYSEVSSSHKESESALINDE